MRANSQLLSDMARNNTVKEEDAFCREVTAECRKQMEMAQHMLVAMTNEEEVMELLGAHDQLAEVVYLVQRDRKE